jgi:hypothetical protein
VIAWVFITMLLMPDGEIRQLKSARFSTWQACETARTAMALERIPVGAEGRVIQPCRSETKS